MQDACAVRSGSASDPAACGLPSAAGSLQHQVIRRQEILQQHDHEHHQQGPPAQMYITKGAGELKRVQLFVKVKQIQGPFRDCVVTSIKLKDSQETELKDYLKF